MNELVVQPRPMPSQANDDEHLIELWLHGRSKHTVRAYTFEIRRFIAWSGKPLELITLGDLQAYADSLTGSDCTRARSIATLKSLFTFGQKLGYLQFNVGAALQALKIRNRLSERILSESQVIHMIELEESPRNRTILRTLYLVGLRVSEIVNMRWADLIARDNGGGQVSIFGKGGKTRVVMLPPSLWAEIQALRGDLGPDEAVFRSSQKRALCTEWITKIVKAAAKRAGIPAKVSSHWMRHAHASHALNRGAPMHLVQATLGHASLQTTSIYAHARPDESSSKYLPS